MQTSGVVRRAWQAVGRARTGEGVDEWCRWLQATIDISSP